MLAAFGRHAERKCQAMAGNDVRWWAITLDCNAPHKLAAFWSAVFGSALIDVGPDRPNWLRLQPLGTTGPFMNFQPVEEHKTSKTRLHLDVLVTDLDAEVRRIVDLGGIDTGIREELARGRIAVMHDPEGNEFCLLAPSAR